MSLRLHGMSELDPHAVPLPHGTQVTTRVDRKLGDRVVPQGAVGRVIASSDDGLDVQVIGVGVVRYLREELTPRKVGQVRYARRRDEAWTALERCIVVDALVGSRAWGLASEGSDEDRRGIFLLPFPWTTGLVEPPQDLVSPDSTRAYWEVGKAIRQGLRADPNTLELLFARTVEVRDEIGAWLLEARDAFVSVEIYGSFGRYALSQLQRLAHNQRLAEHRALVLDWLRADPSQSLDAVAARLATSTAIPAPTPEDARLRARDYLKQLYRSLYDQGILPSREWSALVDLASAGDRGDPELDVPRDLRPKNAYNLIRLIDLAIGWLRNGTPELEVRPALRATLLDIKQGRVALADVLAMAEQMTPELDAARQESRLPRQADLGRAEAVLRRIRAEAARRHLDAAPGPLGADAAPAPAARWDEPTHPSATSSDESDKSEEPPPR
jgi:RNA repair pathway DNA polymerase beta family protein